MIGSPENYIHRTANSLTTSRPPVRQNSGSATPRIRPPATTLNIPGMTRSRVSPDGKIAQRDVGAKLVVIMVGLPARGKSYITKKIQRYLSWQQHECRIFNVGNRRRVAAGTSLGPAVTPPKSPPRSPKAVKTTAIRTGSIADMIDAPRQAAHILLNGFDPIQEQNEQNDRNEHHDLVKLPSAEAMEQDAKFFDPKNEKAKQIREQVAMSTLDELLDYLLVDGGSVGILDATNSTIERRQILFNHIKEREPKLGILFVESVCEDEQVSLYLLQFNLAIDI
jgi:6-phosphofructo-2-kinase